MLIFKIWPYKTKEELIDFRGDALGKPQLLTVLTCTSDFPDDSVRGEDDEVVRPSGLGVAEAISAALTNEGMSLTELCVEEDHGWYLSLEWQDLTFQIVVSDIGGECYITSFRPARGFVAWLLKKPDEEFRMFLETLHDVVESDGRFHNIEWSAVEDGLKDPRGQRPSDGLRR